MCAGFFLTLATAFLDVAPTTCLGIAHKIGADKVEDLIDWSYELGIKTITLYVLSTENLVRECDYLEQLYDLIVLIALTAVGEAS